MTLTLEELLLLFVSLFTLFSPLANIGPFASLVGHLPRGDQRKLALSVFVNAVVVMILFVWVGEALFSVLGVNPNSLTITGSIALMAAALPMMLGSSKPGSVEDGDEPKSWRDMAVVPMTFPMSIDGTTAAYIVSATGAAKTALDLAAISVVVVLFGIVVWLTHLFSPPLAARLQPQARLIVSRIGGIILVAISVQLLAGGLKGLFPLLAR